RKKAGSPDNLFRIPLRRLTRLAVLAINGIAESPQQGEAQGAERTLPRQQGRQEGYRRRPGKRRRIKTAPPRSTLGLGAGDQLLDKEDQTGKGDEPDPEADGRFEGSPSVRSGDKSRTDQEADA